MSETHEELTSGVGSQPDSVAQPLLVPEKKNVTAELGADVATEETLAVVPDEMTEEVAASEVVTFASFGLCAELLQGIKEAGFVEPTLIQTKAIPDLMAGRDLIGQALTGSGKTAAFGLPAMERIRGKSGLNFMVLVPTRELAAQVSSELFKLGHYTGVRTAAFTGGQSYYRQEQLLRQGVNALVATPGRLIDLMNNGHFAGVNPEVVVVDEADEMLDMGFLEDVKKIFDFFPGPRQTMLFSATMPKQVADLARKVLNNPIDISASFNETTNNDIEQQFYVIEEHERVNAVIRLIDSDDVSKAIIFCRTKEETDALNILLGGRGYNVNCLHGDMEQAQRSRVMAAFRRGDIDILVATDVASRGLDVEDVSHVFNFHMPFDSRGYVHRIGRTGRAGKSGKAITLVTPRELRQLEAIKRTVGADIQVAEIPTKQDVLKQRLQRILAELFTNELDPQLYNQVRQLAEGRDQDSLVLFTKLLSKYLASSSDQGPELIGISGDRLERLITGSGRREDRYGDQRGGRDGRNNDRRGGRGGYERERRPAGGSERNYRRDDAGGAKNTERPARPQQRETVAPTENSGGAAPDKAVRQQRNEQGVSMAQRIAADINRGDKPQRAEAGHDLGGRPPRFGSSERPAAGGERPSRFAGSDRPERRFEGERPSRYAGSDRPERRFEGERPPRFAGSDRPERRFEGERPSRYAGSDRPAPGGERPPRFAGSDRPAAGGERPPRFAGSDRPERRFEGERPARFAGSDRPASGGERPARFGGSDRPASGGERPPRFGGSDRPAAGGERPPRFAGSDRPERRFEGERPPRFAGSDRPAVGGERPPRFAGSDRPAAGGERSASGEHKPARFDRHARFDGQSSPKDRFHK